MEHEDNYLYSQNVLDFVRVCTEYCRFLEQVAGTERDEFVDVMRGLRDIDYKGLFNLEILGERGGNDTIREAKLAFIQVMCREMLSDSFVK